LDSSPNIIRSQGNPFGIRTRLCLDDRGVGVRLPAGKRDLALLHNAQTDYGAHNKHAGVKRQGRKADHSLLSSAEVKNCGFISPLPHSSSWHGD
jgi:hypothetical protein